jgi:hypothetical protein
MKKLFFGLTLFLVAVFAGIYWILFTSSGNSIVASFIEKKVNEGQKEVNLKVNDFKLTTSDIFFKATIDDNSIIEIKGALQLLAQRANLAYNINIKDLSKLENLTKQKLNGSFSTKGTAKGDKKLIKIVGESKFASSDTKYDVSLKNFKPSKILFDIKNAKIDELLYTVNKPKYASGLLSIKGDIKNAQIGNLEGVVTTKISNGKLNNTLVNKDFNQKLQNIFNFKGDVVTDLVKSQAISTINLDTTMANIDMKKAVFDIEKTSFNTDYLVTVSNLAKLYDVTQHMMRGAVKLSGNVKQDKNGLLVDGASSLFDGKLDFKLLNDKFTSKINGVEIKKLLHMMYYPEVFTSKSNIDVEYNLTSKVGKVTGKLLNGRFIENEYSRIINTFAKFDITKEIYEKVDLKSDINKNIIKSIIDMKSKNTTITVPNSVLDTDKNTIDALVKTKILKYDFDTTVKGDLSKPKIKVDTSSFIKNKVKDKLKKQIEKKIGKKFNLDKLFNKVTPTDGIKRKPASNEEIVRAFKAMFGE